MTIENQKLYNEYYLKTYGKCPTDARLLVNDRYLSKLTGTKTYIIKTNENN